MTCTCASFQLKQQIIWRKSTEISFGAMRWTRDHYILSFGWRNVCKPKEHGGLGLRLVRSINQVLLAKLAWRLLNAPKSLWGRILLSSYGKLAEADARKQNSKSLVWQGITYGYELLKQGLIDTHSREGGTRTWWKALERGVFTTISAYSLLQVEEENSQFNWKELWRYKESLRGSLLLQKVAHDRLKTCSLLWSRRVVDDLNCLLCGDTVESTIHVARDCEVAKMKWTLRLQPTKQSNTEDCQQ